MMKKLFVAAIVAGLLVPVLGTAQEKKGKTPEERFAALDKNSDKKLSKEEYLASAGDDAEKKSKAETRFAAMDKDKDGSLTLDEFKAGMMKKKE